MRRPSSTKSINSGEVNKAVSIYSALRRVRPKSRRELRNYVKVFLGIDIPAIPVCPEHNSPMDYLWHSFSLDFAGNKGSKGDAVVWANRGGGKTELAAIATLLDCLFKPNSVRGQHIQKLRCDEVELFDADVFAAAKFTTQSKDGIRAAMEMISTMHRPYGLMEKIVSSANEQGTAVFKWCLWEVIEECKDRSCSRCPLWSDCGGKAKRAAGYLKIDDCVTMMRRASRLGWEAEMLCRKPNLEDVVFDEFDPAVHVRPVDYDANLPLYRTLDFGFVNPFVCLWIQVDNAGVVRVIDEYVRSRATIDVHAEQIKQRTPGGESAPVVTFCDPAGKGVNDVTGTSAVRELRALGIAVRYRASTILEGIELIRRAIRAGDGSSRLLISPRCERLIEAMRCYHYPEGVRGGAELPVKDGVYDHSIDALRYFFVNQTKPAKMALRWY